MQIKVFQSLLIQKDLTSFGTPLESYLEQIVRDKVDLLFESFF